MQALLTKRLLHLQQAIDRAVVRLLTIITLSPKNQGMIKLLYTRIPALRRKVVARIILNVPITKRSMKATIR